MFLFLRLAITKKYVLLEIVTLTINKSISQTKTQNYQNFSYYIVLIKNTIHIIYMYIANYFLIINGPMLSPVSLLCLTCAPLQ